jgi:UrcA family protein
MKSFVNIRVTATVLATLVCGSAFADAPVEPSKTVSYADLNLKSSAGVEALYTRLKKAAYEVCQIPTGTHQIRIESELKACKADAIDRAVQQTNLPSLTALHQSKTGRMVDSGQYADRR